MTWQTLPIRPYLPLVLGPQLQHLAVARLRLDQQTAPVEQRPHAHQHRQHLPALRGLHSSTFQLNLSALYGIGGAHWGCVARVKGVLGGVQDV